jgi:phosphate transport system substrate-binding protein
MTTPGSSAGTRNRRLGIVLALLLAAALGLLVWWTIGRPSPPPPPPPGTVVRLLGSGTIGEELVPDLAEAFLQARGATGVTRQSANRLVTIEGTLPGRPAPTRFEITAAGAATAFSGLRDGTVDIGMASRRITPAERAELAGRGDLTARESEHILALDAVAVIVNRDRNLAELSLEQLRDVYTCTITDWSGLGQPAGPIRVLSFAEGSGTLDTFRETVLGGQQLCPAVQRVDRVEELSRTVAGDRAAIGFVGLPFVGNNRALALSSGASTPLPPSQLSVATESYVLTRRLYLYLPGTPPPDPLARDFVENFALGEAGQRIVDATGFVSPLFPPPHTVTPCTADLPAYCALVDRAERISFDVRFSPGTDQVDNRAFRNLDLLAQLLSAPENRARRLLLIGFADNAGTDQANQVLSESRAAQVARELTARGVTVDIQTAGFGEALPVDTNDTPEGREQNRRVEVWLR